MPLYEYLCDACGHRFERIQKFSDPLEEKCPTCGGRVHKLMSSPAIQFKGSGFYITDYAKKDHVAAAKADSANADKSESSEKRSEAAERKSEAAERKSETAERKSEAAERKSETAERKSEAAQRKSDTAEKKSDAPAKTESAAPAASTSKETKSS